MFSGNKLVVILPVVLMLLLFAGGSLYINKAQVVTNEKLNEQIEWDTSFEAAESGAQLEGTWEWKVMPEDGVQGLDYIGVTLLDKNGAPLPRETLKSYKLVVETKEGKKEAESEIVDNGILFSFLTEMEEYDVVGSKGSFTVETDTDIIPERAVVSYLHTWEEHQGIKSKDARFFEREFVGKESNDESFFWVAERFVDVDKESLHAS
ncbi:hypothetical protein [Bacillus piscicola]|uniref:hypothetical protein n=1 Tax=Bacillus piscicola TaxID=1632684 RepID=UPI001F096586|nr:hypothetical protein [Bacillus piscicola]